MITRHGGVMVSVDVETAPAVIQFSDILEKTEVVPDYDYGERPWDSCDWFEHTTRRARDYDHDGARDSQGYTHDGRNAVIIELADDDHGIYDYVRRGGASRGVAREAVYADRQGTLAQLVKWYSDGWEWFGIRCEYRILGADYDSSVWGFDSEEHAQEVCVEVAEEVAIQLEKDGFTIVGRPEPPNRFTARRMSTIVSTDGIRYGLSPRSMTREEWRAEYKRNMASQNWKG